MVGHALHQTVRLVCCKAAPEEMVLVVFDQPACCEEELEPWLTTCAMRVGDLPSSDVGGRQSELEHSHPVASPQRVAAVRLPQAKVQGSLLQGARTVCHACSSHAATISPLPVPVVCLMIQHNHLAQLDLMATMGSLACDAVAAKALGIFLSSILEKVFGPAAARRHAPRNRILAVAAAAELASGHL